MDNTDILDKLDWEDEHPLEYYETKPKSKILYLWHKELAEYVYVLALPDKYFKPFDMNLYWTYRYYMGDKRWAECQANHYGLNMPVIKNAKENK